MSSQSDATRSAPGADPPPAQRRRRRQRSDARERQGTSPILIGVLGLLVLGSALILGGVQVPVTLGLAGLSSVGFGLAVQSGLLKRSIALPALVLMALGLYSALQSLPLPVGVVHWLAPANTEIWRGAYEVLGEPAPTFLPLSLDPGASRVEAVKWLMYGTTFAISACLGMRGLAQAGPTLVFGSAVVLALVTLGHRLVGAEAVYGLYRPVGEFARPSIGPLLNPNNLAGYLNLAVFLGFGLMLVKQPALPRWVSGLGIALLLGVSVETGSRGGLLALGIGFAVFAPIAWRARSLRETGEQARRNALAALGGGVLAGAALALLAVTPRTLRGVEDQSFDKLAMPSWVRPLIEDHPWVGVGRGAFESAFQSYRIGENNLVYSHAENFPVQWMAEWGIPVGVGALLLLAWLLRPKALGGTRSLLALGAFVGLMVLALQNLVDLGLEVPALALAAATAAGSCWGYANRDARPRLRGQLGFGWLPLAIAAGALLLAVLSPIETVGAARRRLDAGLDSLKVGDAAAALGYRRELAAAMRAHPSEPYFPRLAALHAFRSEEGSPLPWINRALELGLGSGRSHYLLARMLGSWGRTEQALLELRFAVTYDPVLAEPVANTALALTREPVRLMRAAPHSKKGARLLLSMARGLSAPTEVSARLHLVREAVRRAPDWTEPREQLAALLIGLLSKPSADSHACQGEARQACLDEARGQGEELTRLSPSSSGGAEVMARLLLLTGDASAAERLLAARCAGEQARRQCLLLRLEAAARSRDPQKVSESARAAAALPCEGGHDCGKQQAAIADTLMEAGEPQLAVGHYVEAAREDGTDKRWLKVADVASQVRQHGLAVEALTRVERRRGRDARLSARIDAERAKAALPAPR